MTFIKRLIRWASAVRRWLARANRGWFAIASVIIIPLLIGFFSPHASNALRYVGLILQLFGIYSVLRGISGRQRLFAKATAVTWIREWLKQFPRWGVQQGSVSMRVGGNMTVSGTALASSLVEKPIGASVRELVEVLWKKVETLQKEQERVAEYARVEIAKLNDAHLETAKEAKSKLAEVLSKLEALAVGGVHIEMMGVVWLAFGVVYATIPGEVACLCAWLLTKWGVPL